MEHVDSHKDAYEVFSGEYYNEQFDGFMFNNDPQSIPFDNLNISSSINQFYPATIAPSALTSSPHDFRRSDSPDATIVGPRNPNGQPQQPQPHSQPQPQPQYMHPMVHALVAGGESSSSPSSSDFQTVPMPSSAVLNGHMVLPALHHNHSTSSLSSVGADVGRPRSSRASPPSSSHDSPRARARTPASPKRNGGSLVHRHSRTASTASSTRPSRRGSTRKVKEEDDFSDFEEDDDFAPHAASDGKPERRREDIRKQRIESEQRRRDELREGYNRLKQALPPSNQKSSKASILERATVCITDLNQKTGSLAARVEELEAELRRVRVLNETLMLSAAEHRFAAAQAGVHLPVNFQQA